MTRVALNRLLGFLVMVAVCGLLAGYLPGQDVRQKQRKLVEQLGDSDYRVRESAAKRLREFGLSAKPVLLEALRDADLEVRMRAHQILVSVLQSDFEKQLLAFIEDIDGSDDHQLPGWSQFREKIGGDRSSRSLFAEMLRAEAPLLEVIDHDGPEVGRVYTQRLEALHGSGVRTGFSVPQTVPAASLAALLFVGAEKNVTSSMVGSRVYSLLNMPSAKQAIQHGAQSKILTSLLSNWIAMQTEGTQGYYGLMLALNYDLKDTGLALSRDLLRGAAAMPSLVVQYAAITVGRYGSPEDIELLEPHLKNTSVCHTWSNPQLKKDLIRIQVRDVVLGMLVHLTSQDHKKYGFKFLQPDQRTVYRVYTMGFLEDEQRDEALKSWQEYRSAGQQPGG